MKERFQSRKFLSVVVVFILSIIWALTGVEISGTELVDSIAKAVGALSPVIYTIVEGFVDKAGAVGAANANVAGYQIAVANAQQQIQQLRGELAAASAVNNGSGPKTDHDPYL